MKYLIFSFRRSGNEPKRGVELHPSPRNVSKIGLKVGGKQNMINKAVEHSVKLLRTHALYFICRELHIYYLYIENQPAIWHSDLYVT